MSTRLTVFAVAIVMVACGGGGGGGSPTGPGSPPPGGSGGGGNQSCRQLPSSYVTTGDGYNTTATCSFDAASVRITCTEQYSDSSGNSTFVAVSTWPARGDVVDEISVLPPVRRATTTTVTQTAGGNFTQAINYSYDGQKRLVREDETGRDGSSTTTYTAWDAAGRPTAGTRVAPSGTITLSLTHDEGARSTTITPSPGAGPCTYTHNENGVVTRIVCANVEVARTTISSTLSVCR